MAGIIVTMSLFGIAFALFSLLTRRFRRASGVPPGPRGWPIIGNALTMNSSNLYLTLTDFANTFGEIFSLQMGPKLIVVLNSLDVAKEAYITQGAAFSKRMMPPAIKYIVGQDGQVKGHIRSTEAKYRVTTEYEDIYATLILGSLIFGDGPTWKERRRFVLNAFRDFGVGKKSLEERVNEEAGFLIEVIEETGGQPVDLHFTVNNAVSNIICSLCFGGRFDYDDERFKGLLRRLHDIVTNLSLGGIVHVFPFLTDTPIYGYLKENFRSVMDFIRSLTHKHWETLNGNVVRDILDKYLLEIERQEESGEEVRFERSEGWRMVFELFLAGTDTTTNTLMFTLMFTTYHQDIQLKIYDEIRDVVGNSRRPQLSDRPNMPYTEATILEVLRHRPAAPLGVPRLVSCNTKVAGYSIPEGSGVFLNTYAINHDPRVWDRPDEFDPTRFLSPDGKRVIKGDALMTFGTGRRACIGEHLARMELFFFVTNILQRFHLQFPDGNAGADLMGNQGITLKPTPFEICAQRR